MALARQLGQISVAELRAAMQHLSGGGKLLRPLLALASYRALTGADPTPFIPSAACLELLHVFSLIHDDLPALDNARLRRGRPAVHVQYGEALAVLAGDGLLALALERLLNEAAPFGASERLAQFGIVSAAVQEMIEGEMLDLLAENREVELEELQRIHRLKTGALLGACCRSAAVWAGAEELLGERLQQLGVELGLAFQIRDDLIGALGNEAEAGKTLSSDAACGKATYPRLLGVSAARTALDEARRRVLDLVAGLEIKEPMILLEFVDWVAPASQ